MKESNSNMAAVNITSAYDPVIRISGNPLTVKKLSARIMALLDEMAEEDGYYERCDFIMRDDDYKVIDEAVYDANIMKNKLNPDINCLPGINFALSPY